MSLLENKLRALRNKDVVAILASNPSIGALGANYTESQLRAWFDAAIAQLLLFRSQTPAVRSAGRATQYALLDAAHKTLIDDGQQTTAPTGANIVPFWKVRAYDFITSSGES